MVRRDGGGEVLVVAPARLVPVVRQTLETLEPAVRRATDVARSIRPLVGVLARAHASMPPRGVVVVVASEDEADHALSLGADEVLLDPSDADALRIAIRRAATRATVRSDRAGETRMLEQVIAGLADSMDAPLAALTLDVDALRMGADEDAGAEDPTALDDCAASIDRVAHLVRDLHLLVPSLADKGALEVIRLPALVDQVLRILGGALARRAHVEREDDDELPEVMAPRRLLARTLALVLVQAADALDPLDADSSMPVRSASTSRVSAASGASMESARPAMTCSSMRVSPARSDRTEARVAARAMAMRNASASDGSINTSSAPRESAWSASSSLAATNTTPRGGIDACARASTPTSGRTVRATSVMRRIAGSSVSSVARTSGTRRAGANTSTSAGRLTTAPGCARRTAKRGRTPRAGARDPARRRWTRWPGPTPRGSRSTRRARRASRRLRRR